MIFNQIRCYSNELERRSTRVTFMSRNVVKLSESQALGNYA
jgi:hypothetical protein